MSRRTTTRASAAVAILAAAVLSFAAIPALAASGVPQHLADQLAACEAMADVAETHAEKAWAEHCVDLATRAIDAYPAEPTPTLPTPSPTASTPAPSTPPPSTPPVIPSPTQTPTATPTTPPPTTTSPPASGWPNAATTGATGPLTVHSGNLTISRAGQVVENLDIRGCVSITAPNVVFRNSKVSCSNGWAIRAVSSGGVVIDQVDVTCNNTLGKGVVGEGFTLRRSDVSGCEDAVYIDRNANVLDSYLHDLYGGGTDPHNDIVQVSNGGDNVIVRGNFLSNRTSRATSGYMGDGPGMDNIVIDRNYFEAGGYAVYCSASGSGNVVSNNTIDALGYGPWYSTCSRSGIVRTNNTLI